MITEFKIFESINEGKPRKDDYVIIKINDIIYEIGKIINYKKNSIYPYLVEFDENFDYYQYGLSENYTSVESDEILYWSNNKEDLEIIIKSQKYNL